MRVALVSVRSIGMESSGRRRGGSKTERKFVMREEESETRLTLVLGISFHFERMSTTFIRQLLDMLETISPQLSVCRAFSRAFINKNSHLKIF